MAELNVQPKKRSPFLWLLFIIIALVLLFLLVRRNKEVTADRTSQLKHNLTTKN